MRIALLAAGVSLFAFGAGGRALAASAADQTAPGSTVGEVVVTALKQGNQNVTRAAASVSVISGQNIEAMGAKNLKDFLQLAPGVSIDDSAAGPVTTQIQIRGINTQFGAAVVGFYIDGVPFSLTNINNLPDVSPFDLNRVEVLKGPQGTLYGAGSSGGVVLIATEDPNMRSFHVKAEAEASDTQGGGGNYRLAGAVNLPLIADKVALRLVGTYDNESGWIKSSISDRKNINGSNSTNFRAKLRITPTDNLTVQLQANVSRTYFDAQNLADSQGRFADFMNDPAHEDW
jgi:outer membrane receptor for ferrienterochelin and colicin